MLECMLNWWRDKSSKVDFSNVLGLAIAGMLHWPKLLIALGAGRLAASPIWKYITTAREHPRVDAHNIVRGISIEVAGYAITASILSYLMGMFLRCLLFPV